MSTQQEQLNELIAGLKQQRDKMRVRLHLAEMEAIEEYGRLSDQIDKLLTQFEPVREAASDTAGNVVAALQLAGEEMKNGLQRIGKSILGSGDDS